ncbi:MAG: 50S ribosomal protein L29 [Rickettsiales bacterium]|nr:50S ribosomal protein L29 [Rickettsiales bacterium]
MKYQELKGKSVDELNKIIADSKKELFNLRIRKSTGELDKTNRFSQVKKVIARVKTYINSTKNVA